MTSGDIPHDTPCDACRRAAEVLAGLEHDLAEQRRLTLALADRCRQQSELLSRAAERAANELARCAAIARRFGAHNAALVMEGG
jgi:exopolyphosphatase/pppGpp-phosphohydrolase